MVADIEELDRIAVILGEFEKRMRARGDDPAAEFKRLRDRPGRGLSDFEIRENDGVAHRHAGKKLGFGLRAHEMDAVGQILRMPSEQLGQAPVGLDDQPRRAFRGEFAELVVQRRVHEAMLEQFADIRVQLLPRGDLLRVHAAEDQQMIVFRQMLQRLNGGSDSFVFVDETENPDQHRVGRQGVEHRKAPARGAAAQRLDLVQ